MAFSTVILQAVAVCALFNFGSHAQSTDQEVQDTAVAKANRGVSWDERYKAALVLLDRAPVLKPTPSNALTEDEFITLTRIVLGTVNLEALGLVNSSVNPSNVHSVDDAIQGLEALISITLPLHTASSTSTRRKPEASITSYPENLRVRYRRTVDHHRNRGTFLSATTNMTRELEPAVYTFICTRANGAEEEQVVNCTKDCLVRF